MAFDPSTLQSLRGPRASSIRASRGLRGFTLVEMMAVVAIIATISALAAPSVIRQSRARRAQRDALSVLAIIQEARSRSLGRGGATRVVWNGTELSLSERMINIGGGAALDLPAPSCSEPGGVWAPSRAWFRPAANSDNTLSVLNNLTCDATGCTGTPSGYLEVCFTSRGQTRVRNGPAAAWAALNQVWGFQIASAEGGANIANRFVFLAPNGLARMRL
jgi:prepilin-type N-terminal cleavage/methylation domain-containing protein